MPLKKKNTIPTKAQTQAAIAEESGISKADVIKVLNALETIMEQNLNKYKQFTINGLIKVIIAHKAATKERPGHNPSTGEAIIIAPKPARDVIRVRALQRLKKMIPIK